MDSKTVKLMKAYFNITNLEVHLWDTGLFSDLVGRLLLSYFYSSFCLQDSGKFRNFCIFYLFILLPKLE